MRSGRSVSRFAGPTMARRRSRSDEAVTVAVIREWPTGDMVSVWAVAENATGRLGGAARESPSLPEAGRGERSRRLVFLRAQGLGELAEFGPEGRLGDPDQAPQQNGNDLAPLLSGQPGAAPLPARGRVAVLGLV